MQIQNSIPFGKKEIKFHLSFSIRKTLGIKVTSDKEVFVTSPHNISTEKIFEKVIKRAPWIFKQIDYFDSYTKFIPVKEYKSGESFYYLGKHLRLKVIKSKDEYVRKNGQYIFLYTSYKDNRKAKENLIKNWYQEKSKKILSKITSECISKYNFSIEDYKLSLRKMKTRWGSFNKNRINLNSSLIIAPRKCIEYVIVHELCHFYTQNHSKKFYKLLNNKIPDWKKRKERLEQFAVYL
jgi:predicted metal-dependent hydrolase